MWTLPGRFDSRKSALGITVECRPLNFGPLSRPLAWLMLKFWRRFRNSRASRLRSAENEKEHGHAEGPNRINERREQHHLLPRFVRSQRLAVPNSLHQRVAHYSRSIASTTDIGRQFERSQKP